MRHTVKTSEEMSTLTRLAGRPETNTGRPLRETRRT
jgi:hypothetical protein